MKESISIENLKTLKSENKLKDVLYILQNDYNLKGENEKTLILNKVQFAKIKRSDLNNTLTEADKKNENKIAFNILNLIDKIDKDEFPVDLPYVQPNLSDPLNTKPKENTTEDKTETKKPRVTINIKKIVINLSLAIIIPLSIYVYQHFKSDQKRNSTIAQLTVFVTDSNGNVVLENEGELNIPLGNRSLNEPIGNNGRTNFGDITTNNIGDSITIGLNAEGWEIDGINKFLFKGEPVKLIVKRAENFGLIKGIVKSATGGILDGAKIMINADTTIVSQKDGRFSVLLPEDYQLDSYKFNVTKDKYENLTETHSASNSLDYLEFELKQKVSVAISHPKPKPPCQPKVCNSDPCKGGIEKFNKESCECQVVVKRLKGCIDKNAKNYDAEANCDDGSCEYIYYEATLIVNSKWSQASIFVDNNRAEIVANSLSFKKIKVKAKKNGNHKIELKIKNNIDTCIEYIRIERNIEIPVCTSI